MTMTSTDPISDMLTRIRNAIAVRKTDVVLPHSKVKESVAKLLVKNNFLDKVTIADASIGKTIHLTINHEDSNAKINQISRLSTPGRRYYVAAKDIPTVKSGRGLVIISTSKGMMSGSDAKKAGVGGELICKVF